MMWWPSPWSVLVNLLSLEFLIAVYDIVIVTQCVLDEIQIISIEFSAFFAKKYEFMQAASTD